MISFKDVLAKIDYGLSKRGQGYTMPLFNMYNGFVGNIMPGKFTVVGGGPSSGRTSFVDSVYIMNVLLQWYSLKDRPPLKIFYFSMNDNPVKKLQSFLCSYLMMTENIRMDIPTLNGQPNRLLNIDEDEISRMAIEDSQVFFDELEEEEILEIIGEPQPPSNIFNLVTEYMKTIGTDEKGKPYELDEEYKNGLVMVIVDSSDNMIPEYDGYGRGNKNDLNNKLIGHIEVLTSRYEVNVTVIAPTDTGFIRMPRDSFPHIKHLGVFGRKCHIGTVLYNPILEKTIKFLLPNDEPMAYISNGKNVLRFWFVVRNTSGADAVRQRYLLLPGSSYCVEHPLDNELVRKFNDVYSVLMETEFPYNLNNENN